MHCKRTHHLSYSFNNNYLFQENAARERFRLLHMAVNYRERQRSKKKR